MIITKTTRPEDILEHISGDGSKIFKERAIGQLADINHDEFFDGIRLALDNFDTFGVKKIPTHSGPEGEGLSMTAFAFMADKLVKRELTGGDAQRAIEAAMRASTKKQWDGWYRRILMKKLDAGFSETTVNKAVKDMAPEYLIPVFGCQLAHDSGDHESKVAGLKYIDVKLDGARCLTFVNPDGRVFQTSRNGKEIENFPLVVNQFKLIAANLSEPMVFDGEMMSASFQDLMKQFKRKDGVQTDDSIYYCFDALPLKEFRAGKSVLKQKERVAKLSEFFAQYGDVMPNVSQVGVELVDLRTEEGKNRFQEINIKAIEGGYEGIMIKDPEAYYECKRSVAWLKKKPVIEITMTVVEAEEGKPDSKYRGMLGALVCIGFDSQNRLIKVNCGGGFSDDLRDRLWKVRDELPGVLVEVEADAITQNQNGEYSLRFPRFKTFRGQVPGEQI